MSAESGRLPITAADLVKDPTLIPPFPSMADLVERFGGRDQVITAYVNGLLPRNAVDAVEADHQKLACWLLVRLIRQQEGA